MSGLKTQSWQIMFVRRWSIELHKWRVYKMTYQKPILLSTVDDESTSAFPLDQLQKLGSDYRFGGLGFPDQAAWVVWVPFAGRYVCFEESPSLSDGVFDANQCAAVVAYDCRGIRSISVLPFGLKVVVSISICIQIQRT